MIWPAELEAHSPHLDDSLQGLGLALWHMTQTGYQYTINSTLQHYFASAARFCTKLAMAGPDSQLNIYKFNSRYSEVCRILYQQLMLMHHGPAIVSIHPLPPLNGGIPQKSTLRQFEIQQYLAERTLDVRKERNV